MLGFSSCGTAIIARATAELGSCHSAIASLVRRHWRRISDGMVVRAITTALASTICTRGAGSTLPVSAPIIPHRNDPQRARLQMQGIEQVVVDRPPCR